MHHFLLLISTEFFISHFVPVHVDLNIFPRLHLRPEARTNEVRIRAREWMRCGMV